MAENVFKKHFSNPDFQKLTEDEQIEVLGELNAEFKKEPRTVQMEVLNHYGKMESTPEEGSGAFIGGVVGGVAGGLLGSRVGHPQVGSTIGTGVGAATGELVDQALAKKSVIGDGDYIPSGEELKQAGKAAGTEMAWDVAGAGAFGVAKKAFAPFKGAIKPRMNELNNFLSRRMKEKGYKMSFLPSEMAQGDSWFLNVWRNIAEASILGGGSIKKFKYARNEVFNEMADDAISQYGARATSGSVGKLFLDVLEKKRSFHSAIGDSLYNTLKDETAGVERQVTKEFNALVGQGEGAVRQPYTRTVTKVFDDARIPTKEFKKFANEIEEVAKEIKRIGGGSAGYDLSAKISQMGDTISYSSAQDLRTSLMAAADEFALVSKKARGIGRAKHLAGLVDGAIEKGLKSFDKKMGKTTYDQWRNANKFNRLWKGKFDNVTLRRLVKYADESGKGFEFIAADAFKSPQRIKAIKTALGEGSQEWKTFQSFYIQNLFKNSVDPASMRNVVKHGKMTKEGMVNANMMLKKMYGGEAESIGAETLQQVFTPTQLKRLDTFVDALAESQRKESDGIGKMWIQLTQAGAIMGFTTGLAPQAAGIILGPAIMSKLLTTELGAKYLTTGVKTLKGDSRVAGLSARILNQVMKISKEREDAYKETSYLPKGSI
jgi:hypothetical protein